MIVFLRLFLFRFGRLSPQDHLFKQYILSLLLFGTNGLVVARISLASGHIVLYRTLIGGLVLTALVFLRGGFALREIRSELWPLLMGGAALGLNWIALFSAYRLLNVSLATLIYYAGPMLVMLLSPLLFREKLTGGKLTAIAVVTLGLVLISGSIAAAGLSIPGLLAAAGSALFYAALIVFNKRIRKSSRPRAGAFSCPGWGKDGLSGDPQEARRGQSPCQGTGNAV